MTLMVMVLAVLIVLIGAFVAQRALSRQVQQSQDVLYAKQQHLFSPAERSFLNVLDEAVSDHYRVFGKVRVADVLEVKTGMDKRDRRAALNRIISKHFDYVLCRKDDLSFVCAIELDDRSHQRPERRERDQFLDVTCKQVEFPLLRIQARASYSIPTVRTQVLGTLGTAPAHAATRASSSSRLEPVMRAAAK